jgi:uncharacterized protein YndB with AHSA1/START domain
MDEVNWILEHVEVAAASPEFVWRYWTDVRHWHDPGTVFAIDGEFVDGARGTTTVEGGHVTSWTLQDVIPGHGYTIKSPLAGARLLSRWTFAPARDGGTTLRQQIGLGGERAGQYAADVHAAFASGLAAGMQRIAAILSEAYIESGIDR